MPWTEEQKEYAQRVAIATLIGGVSGGLIGTFASEPKTLSKTSLGVVLGAGLVGAGYGIYLRGGGAPGASFAGLGSVLRYPHFRGAMGRVGRRKKLGRIGAKVQHLGVPWCGNCGTPNKAALYESARVNTMQAIGSLRGTYEISPGTCGEFGQEEVGEGGSR